MRLLFYVLMVCVLFGCQQDDSQNTPNGVIQLASISIGTQQLSFDATNEDFEVDQPIVARFNKALDTIGIQAKVLLTDDQSENVEFTLSFLDGAQTISLKPNQDLKNNHQYTLEISQLTDDDGNIFDGITITFNTKTGTLTITSITINNADLTGSARIQNVDVDFEIRAEFSHPIDPASITEQSVSVLGVGVPETSRQLENDNQVLVINASTDLKHFTRYRLKLSAGITTPDGHDFEGLDKLFYTALDSTYKFPEISDEDLLTKVQEQTFKYFWDFSQTTSGLTRERNSPGNTVTIGGSGFGLMTILVGIERGFITRQEGIDRLETVVDFLTDDAERYHGVWPHWLNGDTGATIPFSADDDGGDLVETSFMIQGLLTVRQYLNSGVTQESTLINKINVLWEEVEWDWYTQGDQDVLYWHWSPNFGWQKNLQIRGWNESLITYVLAASSTTHTVPNSVYTDGWARTGGMQNGESYYGIELQLGSTRGGPLFFSHYSFLGLDPRNLEDQYANYWDQNVAHSQINRSYCIANTGDYIGYGANSWGLTASDNHEGYSAHSPTNDRGVITPTAAISSIPYTPEESMDAIKHFYYLLGDKLWGEYGFYDAFNPTESWYASSYLAIDQGPIICMIENHRTGFLWDLFMSAPEIQDGLDKLGFSY